MEGNGTILYKRNEDGLLEPVGVDQSTNSLYTIDHAHHEIHEGDHFFYTDCLTLASAGAQDYLITTPNTTKWTHLSFSAHGSAITEIKFFEASDKSGTTAQTIVNNNRNSTKASANTLHKGTSGGTTDGTQIWCSKGGSATGASSREGISSGQDTEIILKQNTKYILRITSGTNDNLVNLALAWYEHTNK
jgi:hypothetical protein